MGLAAGDRLPGHTAFVISEGLPVPGSYAADVIEWGAPLSRARCAVIAVHGRGLDPEDMRERSESFCLDDVRYYALRAPAGSWYPHSFLEPIGSNQEGVDTGMADIARSTERALEDGFDPAAIAVWGFSQGACLLTHYLLTSPRARYGAAVLFTGGYIGTVEPTVQARHLEGLPVVLRSIQHDPFVPAERVQATARLLTEAGAAIDVRIDPGDEHIITAEAYRRGSELIAALASG